MARQRSYSPDFKLRVVMEVMTGEKRPSEVCREHWLKDSLLLTLCRSCSTATVCRALDVSRSSVYYHSGERDDSRAA